MGSTMRNVTVTAADGGKFDAYLAIPEGGSGPGVVLLHEILGINRHIRDLATLYADEGYVTIAPDLFWRLQPGVELAYSDDDIKRGLDLYSRFDADQAVKDIADTLRTLRPMSECRGAVAALGFCMGGMLAYLTAARCNVEAAVSYYGVGIEKLLGEARAIRCPMVMHFGEADEFVPAAAREAIVRAFAGRDEIEIYTYPGACHGFNTPIPPRHEPFAASLAHSRTIGFLRCTIGPRFDLGALWERHSDFEFKYRDADATMTTMVDRPYVNHVPTMTGGVGQQELHRFYKHHFIAKLPKDLKIVPISRTVGSDRLVDELLFCFTHDTEIDFLLPGIAPTGKYVEIPTVAIVQFRGGKIAHEHIHWDQATALVQLGLLDPKGLATAGHEIVEKLRDETRPSNVLMKRWKESEGED